MEAHDHTRAGSFPGIRARSPFGHCPIQGGQSVRLSYRNGNEPGVVHAAL
jgi:hypothetical protein